MLHAYGRMSGVMVLVVLAAFMVTAVCHADREVRAYKQHSEDRELPPRREASAVTVEPPSDATVLFDGTDLSKWKNTKGGDAPWKLEDDYMEVVPDKGSIMTKKKYGDAQLHVEWCVPEEVEGHGQHVGNSGVFFGVPGQTPCWYEVQVLSNHENETYADGMAGALYGQYPPLVNVCRPKGEWQSFDIIFRLPRFDQDGNVEEPATMTVLHNGVVVQDSETFIGPTAHGNRPGYTEHGRLPIMLQDHGQKVRFRNVWVRPLNPDKR